MPSVLTHYGFNKEVFDNNVDFLINNEDIYLVGAQGPDPFFFRGIVPSLKNKNVSIIRKYGSKLHKLDPSEVFFSFFKYANENKENKNVLYSYIFGAGLHYILDRKIHPYVFYKTGFSDEQKKKAKYFACHTLFETNLDVLLMHDRFNRYKVKPCEAILCDENKVKTVSEMYGVLAKEIVKEDVINKNSFYESYKDMIKIENILYSKKGVKKKIVNFLFKNTPFNTMMHPLVVKDDNVIDYLNIRKKEWKDPSSEVSFNKSIYDLIDEAKEEVEAWIKIVKDSYIGLNVNDKIKSFTKGLIYDGYDNKNGKMKVFDNVYERKEKNK